DIHRTLKGKPVLVRVAHFEHQLGGLHHSLRWYATSEEAGAAQPAVFLNQGYFEPFEATVKGRHVASGPRADNRDIVFLVILFISHAVTPLRIKAASVYRSQRLLRQYSYFLIVHAGLRSFSSASR